MKATVLFGSVALSLLPFINADSVSMNKKHTSRVVDVKPRALPDAPNGYAPVHVTCPSSRPSIRAASMLSPEETAWLKTRRQKTESALKDFFGHNHSSNSSYLPNIAIGISGGGLVACLNGGGAIKAFDERTEGSTAKGQLGGLLQSATYFAALSGGSWALGSIYMNNFTTVSNLQENLWDFTSPQIILGPASTSMTYFEFWGTITAQVKSKRAAGFVTSDPDFWGRIQGYNFFNPSHGGVDYTWSSIAKTQAFQNGDMPLPLVVMTGNYFDTSEEDSSPNDPIYETTPWEWGTYDDDIYGFAPLEYLGTRFVDGVVPENETCGNDLVSYLRDELSLLMANSPNSTELPLLEFIIKEFLSATSSTNSTVNGPASYDLNPFYQYNTATSPFAKDTRLTVEDGGENGQNIPLYPLIQRKRNVDVIFAVDSLGTDDVDYDWPTGSTLIATYNRTLANLANDTSFPPVPDLNTFLNLGLNAGPSFFGCNASNLSTPAPLVVYLPNHPITYSSNYTLTQGNFTDAQRDAVITNGYNVVTQANGTIDSDWSTCVGCAVLSRSFDRTGTVVPEACNKCFQRYCWNGTVDNQPPAPYTPTPSLSASSSVPPTAYSRGPVPR
ncbi:lysophospholipase 1 [Aspergillus cavernicola]|uniref:Lysophospholipase n=1 Tax=Aspergillus cavernicola TaxID=176166 RepID=A0ABR4ISS6_9EURO